MSSQMKRTVLPFSAIVGQDKLKLSLILNAINTGLLGVLIRGEKGTGKSTAVRALADLLPEIDVVRCPFNCSPHDVSLQCAMCRNSRQSEFDIIRRKMKVVELPLGATEDRVTGTLDIERALQEGIKALEPGILAEANQGILYIDEVNLLDDHLVDVLLDSAAMGVNTIEREGISVAHPAQFLLVGTMNPEEGELRPQLLDRFGLSVEVKGMRQPEDRIRVIKTVEAFGRAPEAVLLQYEEEQKELSRQILEARELLRDVDISENLVEMIVGICLAFEVQGHRADFLIARTAKTIAAYNRRSSVTREDIRDAAEFVIPHRMRRMPFEETKPVTVIIDQIMRQSNVFASADRSCVGDDGTTDDEGEDDGESHMPEVSNRRRPREPIDVWSGKKFELRAGKDKKRRSGSGRRAKSLTTHDGKYIRAEIPEGRISDIAIDATIRAAVARSGSVRIEKQDIREKVRAKKVSSVIVFVVDASGSMTELRGMKLVRESVMALLDDSYRKRDKVGFIAVSGEEATVLLQPSSSVELAVKCLRQLPVAGKTPLADGLYKGLQVLNVQRWKNRNIVPIMVLVSDGRGNVPIVADARGEALSIAREIRKQEINMVVIDSDDGFLNLGYNREIAAESGGRYYRLDDFNSGDMVDIVETLAVC